MIFRRTFLAVALPLALFVLAALPAFFGCLSKASEFELQPYDSRLRDAVDRAPGGSRGAIVVMDVASGKILGAKNLEVAGQQVIRPGSTLKPFVLMELLYSGKLDPRQRLICRRRLPVAGMRLECSHTADELLAAYRKLALMSRKGNTSTDEAVFLGLEHAVTCGTAHRAKVDGVKIAGKTGTASASDNPRTNGIFVGYAPADDPEIAMVVYVPRGRGLDAAMVTHSVLEEYAQIKKKP